MTTHRFDGRVVVVTGAARGIGRAYAVLLGELGASVIVNDLGGSTTGTGHDPEPARAAAAEIVGAGGRAVADDHDISTAEGGQAVVDAAIREFGRIDVVVNNAGNVLWGGPADVDPASLQKTLDVHVHGSLNTTRAAWPHMLEQNYGRIVMTGSTGMFGLPDNLSYAISKAGTIGMVRSLNMATRGKDIKINVICPNAMTRLGAAPGSSLDTGGTRPAPAGMEPEHVAPMVAFLAHETCPVSGEVYVAGAGRFGRIFIAANEGYLHGIAETATVDDIAAHWDEINDEGVYYVPTSLFDWAARFMSPR